MAHNQSNEVKLPEHTAECRRPINSTKSKSYGPYFLYIATFCSSVSMFIVGASMGWVSPTVAILTAPGSPIPMTPDEGSWLISISGLGLIISSFPSAWMTENFGRKNTLLLGGLPQLIGWLAIAFATDIATLMVARFMFGLSYGLIFTPLGVYISEIASDKIRGFLLTLQPVILKVGCLFAFAVGPYVSIRSMALSMAVPTVFFLCTSIWLPESPYYWLGRGETVKADKSLTRFRGNRSPEQNASELNQMAATIEKTDTNASISDMWAANSRRGLTITLMLAAIATLCGNGAMLNYSQLIFTKINSSMSAVDASILLASVQLLSAVVGNVTIDIVGRRPLLLVSTLVMCLSTAVVSIYFMLDRLHIDVKGIGWLAISVLMMFQMAFNVGLDPVSYTYLGELFSKRLKSLALAVFMVVFAILDALVMKVFQIVADEWGYCDIAFAVFTAFTLVFLVFAVVNVPETKGKGLDIILEEMCVNDKKLVKVAPAGAANEAFVL